MTHAKSRFGHLASDRADLNARSDANRRAGSAGIVPGLVISSKCKAAEIPTVAQTKPKPVAAMPIDRSYAGGFAAANARAATVFASGAIKGREVFAIDMLINTDLPAASIIALVPKCIGDASEMRAVLKQKASGPTVNHGWAGIHATIAERRAEQGIAAGEAN